MKHPFGRRLNRLQNKFEELTGRRNEMVEDGNGVFDRYRYPILTAMHTPLFWRYDLNEATNPFLMERFGINAAFNAGAMKWKNNYILAVRMEGADRKSFFAIAESPNGIDQFKFWDHPVDMPGTAAPETNIYDMRL